MARRWLIIVAWFVGSFLGWALVCHAAVFALMYAANDRGMRLPGWLESACNIGLVGVGLILVPVAMLVLAILGRLPGTRPASTDRRRGFPVKTPPPAGTP